MGIYFNFGGTLTKSLGNMSLRDEINSIINGEGIVALRRDMHANPGMPYGEIYASHVVTTQLKKLSLIHI